MSELATTAPTFDRAELMRQLAYDNTTKDAPCEK